MQSCPVETSRIGERCPIILVVMAPSSKAARATALIAVLLVSSFAIGQQETGTVCIAARIDDPFWKEEPRLANGQVNTHGLRLRIDNRRVLEWPLAKSLKIEGLGTTNKHMLAVLDSSNKPIESLWFKFSQYRSTDLCMTYDGYQGVQLHDVTRHTPWCKCKENHGGDNTH
jgi:hypothetical protein